MSKKKQITKEPVKEVEVVKVEAPQKPAPIRIAFTIARDDEMPGYWNCYRYEIQGDKILSVTKGNAEIKAVIIERFSISCANELIRGQ